jgi:hypothetical protein
MPIGFGTDAAVFLTVTMPEFIYMNEAGMPAMKNTSGDNR